MIWFPLNQMQQPHYPPRATEKLNGLLSSGARAKDGGEGEIKRKGCNTYRRMEVEKGMGEKKKAGVRSSMWVGKVGAWILLSDSGKP